MRPYEVVEHTADIGIRAFGRTRRELFSHMAEGMFSLIAPPEAIRVVRSRTFRARADGWERLLVAFLRELLYRFDTQRFIGRRVRVTHLEEGQVEAQVRGEVLDPDRHPVEREVKAVTYCDLQILRRKDGFWEATVIFDI